MGYKSFNSIHLTYGELIQELEGIEEINFRLIRGLAQILERRCVIETESAIDPIAARRAVFEESGGFVTGEDGREKVLNKAAGRLSLAPAELERALWADQEDNLAVKEFRTLARMTCSSSTIYFWLRLFFSGLRAMEIQVEDNYQPLFRKAQVARAHLFHT